MVGKFRELTEGEWEGLKGGSYVQSLEMRGFYEKRGLVTYLVGVVEGEKVVAKGLLVGRGRDFWVGNGPVLDFEDLKLIKLFMEGLVGFARSHGMVRVEVFPEVVFSVRDEKGEILGEEDLSGLFGAMRECGFSYNGRLMSNRAQARANRWVFVKDLAQFKTVEELRLSYKRNLRWIVRKYGGGLEVERVGREDLELVKHLIDESGKKHGIIKPDLAYYQEFFDSFGEKAWFMVARSKETHEAVAGGVFILHGGEMSYFLAGSSQEHLKMEGMRILQDYMLGQALVLKCRRYNFLGIEGEFKDNPLLRFKADFGGEVVEYVGGFRKVVRPGRYLFRQGGGAIRCLARGFTKLLKGFIGGSSR